MTDFSDQFRTIIMRYKRIGYNLDVMRQAACLFINPINVDGYAAHSNCTPMDRASDSMMARPKAIHFSWLGPELSSVAWSTGAQLIIFFCFRCSVVLFDRPGISIRHAIHCEPRHEKTNVLHMRKQRRRSAFR